MTRPWKILPVGSSSLAISPAQRTCHAKRSQQGSMPRRWRGRGGTREKEATPCPHLRSVGPPSCKRAAQTCGSSSRTKGNGWRRANAERAAQDHPFDPQQLPLTGPYAGGHFKPFTPPRARAPPSPPPPPPTTPHTHTTTHTPHPPTPIPPPSRPLTCPWLPPRTAAPPAAA